MRSEVKKLGRDYRGDTPETGEGDDTFPRHQGLAHAAPEGPPAKHEGDISGQLRSRGRQHISGQLRSTRETSLARTTHRWDPASPANAGWQQMEATDASHCHITTTTPATPRGTTLARLYTAMSAKPRETTLPWPDTYTTHLRSRGRQHFSGQVLHLHVCEAEGRPWPDTTSPHRHRPRERLPDPENCPREHISDKEHFTPR